MLEDGSVTAGLKQAKTASTQLCAPGSPHPANLAAYHQP